MNSVEKAKVKHSTIFPNSRQLMDNRHECRYILTYVLQRRTFNFCHHVYILADSLSTSTAEKFVQNLFDNSSFSQVLCGGM